MTTTTWNPSDKLNVNLTNSNLTAAWPGNNFSGVRGTTSKTTGKWYFEYNTIAIASDFHPGDNFVGLAPDSSTYTLGNQLAAPSTPAIGASQGNLLFNFQTNPNWITGNGDPSGHVLCIAVDLDAQLVWFRNDSGNWNNSGTADPATGTGGLALGCSPGTALFLCACTTTISVNNTVTMATQTIQFAQSPPSGFSAWDSVPNIWASVEAPDTFAGAGYPGLFGISGELISTEAPDTFAGIGYPTAVGTWASTEAKDIFGASGHLPFVGTWASTEATDTFAAVGMGVGENGIWVSTEATDTFAAIGQTPIVGTFNVTEITDRFVALGAGVTQARRRRHLIVT
jgi:hypothetical protein